MRIVSIEGCDGSGKTTQAGLLVARMRKEGFRAIYIRPVFLILDYLPWIMSEGGASVVSPRRARVSHVSASQRNKRYLGVMKRLLLAMGGYPYALTIYLFMRFYLSRGNIIVCDRYFYQFFYDLYGAKCKHIIKFFPRADTVFFLDGDPEVLFARMNDTLDKTVDMAYYTKVVDIYRELAERYSFICIDASLDEQSINDSIHEHLMKSIGIEQYE